MRTKILGLLAALALAVTAVPAAASPPRFPDLIDLPGGFFPEGIAVGYGSTVYTGSLVDGAIWRGSLRSGDGSIFVEGEAGRPAVGMDFDRRSGYLWVSGGPVGEARVYDGKTGEELAVLELGAGFINDVIVTRRAAYFTNSFAPEIYSVPLDRHGLISGPVTTIPLSGDFQFAAGEFNANGIEATRNGRTLIVVNSFFGEIYTVKPHTGEATLIDLAGAVVNGDGLVLVGRQLYAVEGGKNQITEIRLSRDLSGGIVTDTLTNPNFDVPTTAAAFGRSLYAVNAKFGTPATPETPYEIVSVRR